MKHNTHKNYLPCLLDRLIDHNPHKRYEDVNYHALYSINSLKRSLIKEMAHILNSKAKLPSDGINEFPEVFSSAINFGIDDTCGKLMGPHELNHLEVNIKDALLAYEPRLDPETIEVIIKDESLFLEACFTRYSVEIHGMLMGVEQPTEIIIRTALDLEDGQFHVIEDQK